MRGRRIRWFERSERTISSPTVDDWRGEGVSADEECLEEEKKIPTFGPEADEHDHEGWKEASMRKVRNEPRRDATRAERK